MLLALVKSQWATRTVEWIDRITIVSWENYVQQLDLGFGDLGFGAELFFWDKPMWTFWSFGSLTCFHHRPTNYKVCWYDHLSMMFLLRLLKSIAALCWIGFTIPPTNIDPAKYGVGRLVSSKHWSWGCLLVWDMDGDGMLVVFWLRGENVRYINGWFKRNNMRHYHHSYPLNSENAPP